RRSRRSPVAAGEGHHRYGPAARGGGRGDGSPVDGRAKPPPRLSRGGTYPQLGVRCRSASCTRRLTMRRLTVVAFVLGFVLSAALLRTVPGLGSAQPASPMAMGTPVGFMPQLLASGLPAIAPGKVLGLYRVTFAPGGFVTLHAHPGASLIYVESGTLGYTLQRGQATLTRAAAAGTPGPTEQLTPGVEVLAQPGDSLFEQQGVHHVAR